MPATRARSPSLAARNRKTLKTRAREDEGFADAAADPKAKRRLRQRAREARKLAQAMK
ncbi:MAG: hypothetical protein JO289_01215 [Xanthobacteraceae bacterium]|nr:hypothetical protein [Xanthobacteraceae bacterium]